MKTRFPRSAFALALFLFAAVTALQAQLFTGTEDFSGTSLKWGSSFPLTANAGGGAFTFGAVVAGASASPVLEFTKSTAGQGDQMKVWKTNGAGSTSFATSWVMEASATNLVDLFAADAGRFAAIGIEVSTGAGSYTGIMLESYGTIGTTVLLETNDFNDQIYQSVGVNEDVLLRLAWDASAQKLTGSYSLNSGASFTVLGVVDIMQGADQWPVAPTGGFSFEVFGYSNHTQAILPGQMYLDNFSVTAVPEPSTYAALAGLGALGLVFWRQRRR